MAYFLVLCLLLPLVSSEPYDTFGREADRIVKMLSSREEFGEDMGHWLNQFQYSDSEFIVGNSDFFRIEATDLTIEGIETLHRTSPATGDVARCNEQEISRVELRVKNGINITAKFKFMDDDGDYSGNLLAEWKNRNQDAIFILKKLKFEPGKKMRLGESANNIFNDKFNFQLVCYNQKHEHKCNQMQVHYLSGIEFDVHRHFQDIFEWSLKYNEYPMA